MNVDICGVCMHVTCGVCMHVTCMCAMQFGGGMPGSEQHSTAKYHPLRSGKRESMASVSLN